MLGLYEYHDTSHVGHVSSTVMTVNEDFSSRPTYKVLDSRPCNLLFSVYDILSKCIYIGS